MQLNCAWIIRAEFVTVLETDSSADVLLLVKVAVDQTLKKFSFSTFVNIF